MVATDRIAAALRRCRVVLVRPAGSKRVSSFLPAHQHVKGHSCHGWREDWTSSFQDIGAYIHSKVPLPLGRSVPRPTAPNKNRSRAVQPFLQDSPVCPSIQITLCATRVGIGSSSSFYLPNNTKYVHLHEYDFRRAGQQGPIRTLHAGDAPMSKMALSKAIIRHTGD